MKPEGLVGCTCGRVYQMRGFYQGFSEFNEYRCLCGAILYAWHEAAIYRFELVEFAPRRVM